MYLQKCEIVNNGNGTSTITGPCFVTKKSYSLIVPTNGLVAYHKGEYVQEAFSNVSPAEREFIISGVSPEGWKQMFGKRPENLGEEENN